MQTPLLFDAGQDPSKVEDAPTRSDKLLNPATRLTVTEKKYEWMVTFGQLWYRWVENHQAVVKFTTGVVKFTAKVNQSKFGTKATCFPMVVPAPVFSTRQSTLTIQCIIRSSESSLFCSGSYMFFSWEKLENYDQESVPLCQLQYKTQNILASVSN